jgi:hypothetical protein
MQGSLILEDGADAALDAAELLTLNNGHDAWRFGAAAREVIQGRPSTASASTSSGDATSLSAAPPLFVVELEGLIERHSLPKHGLTLERIVSLVKQLALHEPPPHAVDYLTKPMDATLVHNLKLLLRTPKLSSNFVALAVEVARAPSLNFQVACIRHGAKAGAHLFDARAMALARGRVEPVARELLERRLLDLDHSTPIDLKVAPAHSMAAEVLLAHSGDVDAAVAHLEAQGDDNEGLDEDKGGDDDNDDEAVAIDKSVEDRSYAHAPHHDEVRAIAASDGSEQVPLSSYETGSTREVAEGRPISSLPNAMHIGAALAAAEAAVTRQSGRCDLTELVVADLSRSQPAPSAATNVARSADARKENSSVVAAAMAAALQDRASASSVSSLHCPFSAMVQTHFSSPSLSTLWAREANCARLPAAREATLSGAQAVATPIALDFQFRSGGDVTAPMPHDAADLEETVDGVKLVRSRNSATGYKGVYFMQSAARHGARDESSESHAQGGRSIFHARGVEGPPSGWDTATHGVWHGESRFLGYCT